MKVNRHVAVVVVCAAMSGPALAGCGDAGIGAADRPKAAPASAEVRRQLSDRLSPASMVMRFWASIQHGALPLSLEIYEPRVVSAVGIPTFAGMLQAQRASAQDTRLNLLRIEDVAAGRLITAETVPKVGSKTRHTFFLRPVRGRRPVRWRIAYDTLSVGAIQTYVQTQTQRSVDPAAAPGRKAVAAGDAAADAYRRASLVPAPKRRRRPARAPVEQPAATTTTPAVTTTTP